MKSEICDYISRYLQPMLTDEQRASADLNVSTLLLQPLGRSGLGLSTGSVIALAIDLEQHFAIRLNELGTEQLAEMTATALADCVSVLVDRTRAVMHECAIHELPTRRDILEAIASLTGQEVEEVPESLDSMEVLWLLVAMEQRYGRSIELPPDAYQQSCTVEDAVRIFREAVAAAFSSNA